MAGKGEGKCSSCAMETKYICLKCKQHCCAVCSEMEIDEEIPGWKAGKSVGYCEACTLKMLDEESVESDQSGTNLQCSKECESSSCTSNNQLKKKMERLKELVHDSPSSDEEKEYLKQNKKKGKEKKKPGRKSNWSPEAVDDFIDIVVNDDYYKRKLIFTNTKNQKNGVIYEKILLQLKERAAKRGDILQFTVPQLRTKFKKCISDCKHVALTMKTATGIKRFQEERGFGKWFNMLFPLVKSRDSCKPELALEPSSVEQQLTKKASPDDGKEGIFIPVKKKQKVKASDKISESAIEAINVVKDTLKNDPTKDLIAFMKEELEKSREHELKLVGLMQSFRQTDAQYPPHQLPSFGGMPCNEGSSLAATNYSSWNIAIGTRVHNQPAAYHYSDVASSSIPESQSTQIHYDGKKAYQKL